MKGAFSSPEGVLDRVILNTLFPDTSYRNESGGDPDVIPELTYEQFLNFHKKYYHPSNSYIYLYGDMDMEEKLNWLDQEYLSKFDYLAIDSEIRFQKPFEQMKEVEMAYSITSSESEKDNTYLSYNKVIGTSLDEKLYLAFQNYSYFTMLILLSVYLRISHHHSCRMCSICLALRINFSLISSNNFLCHCPRYRFLGKL